MKTTLLSFLLPAIFLSFLLTACKKDPAKNAKLPPITQEGKNTIGFTIDGEVWVPYYKCRYFGNPCGEIQASYGEVGGSAQNAFDLNVIRLIGNSFSALTITSSGNGTITTVGDKIDTIHVIFQDERINGYIPTYYGPLPGSKFIITKFDYPNQIISGEFEFILREQSGSRGTITIKDGRFDFKLNTCKCSN